MQCNVQSCACTGQSKALQDKAEIGGGQQPPAISIICWTRLTQWASPSHLELKPIYESFFVPSFKIRLRVLTKFIFCSWSNCVWKMFVKQFYANFFHFGHLKIGHHVCNDLGVCGLQSCIFWKVYFANCTWLMHLLGFASLFSFCLIFYPLKGGLRAPIWMNLRRPFGVPLWVSSEIWSDS